MTLKRTILAMAAVAAAHATLPIHAATQSGNLVVKADVAANCILGNISDLDFGTYTPTAGSVSASTMVPVRCSRGTPYAISISAGTSGSFATRTMKNGLANLEYNLFVDAPATTIWGDGTGATDVVKGTGNGLAARNTMAHLVYGVLPDNSNNQDATPGSYQETVVVTITY